MRKAPATLTDHAVRAVVRQVPEIINEELRSLPKELRDKLWLYIVHSFDPIPQEVIKYFYDKNTGEIDFIGHIDSNITQTILETVDPAHVGQIQFGFCNIREADVDKILRECCNIRSLIVDKYAAKLFGSSDLESSSTKLTNLRRLKLVSCTTLEDRFLDKLADSNPNLEKITLSGCDNLSGVSFYVLTKKLQFLTHLKLAKCQMAISPTLFSEGVKCLAKFGRIKSLKLPDNKLTTMPSELRLLRSLKKLDLSQNNIAEIPRELGELVSLKKVYLSFNDLPIGNDFNFRRWKNLKELDLSLNYGVINLQTEFPESLEFLSLRNNKMIDWPRCLFNLTNLTSLNLGNCSIAGALPSGFTTFNKLTSLSLFENEFEFDPDFDFGKLSSLRNLHMFDNKMLMSLPSSFKKLAQLTTLGLMKSKFETVPLEICALPNVHRLYIGVNNLTTLRPEIGGMTALSLLAADQNKIATLSHTMTQLKNLMSISMIHNKLGKNSDLNSEIICKIPFLEIARLRFNKLKSFRVPTDKFYRSLTDLDISDNDLESLPDSFSNLQSLRRADISRNQFTCIPKPVFDLPDLAELLAEENSITQVPSEIGQLTGLRMLHLSFNMINSVAEELVKLTRLDDLRIHPLYLDLTTSREDLQHLLHRTTA